jgi:hypothetical protein
MVILLTISQWVLLLRFFNRSFFFIVIFVIFLCLNSSFCNRSSNVFASIPSAFFDIHAMVSHPEKWVNDFAAAGANSMTFHIEVRSCVHLRVFLDLTHFLFYCVCLGYF